MHDSHPLRIFGASAVLTLALAVVVAFTGGLSALWLYAVLVLLEVTFSFDNAVVNSKVLTKLSSWWQVMFLTVGVFIAVFVVRFLLPVLIVMLTAGLGGGEVIDLALNHPAEYGHKLEEAAPLINAFGGVFLLMIGLSYFVDRDKDLHWIQMIEQWLATVARLRHIKLVLMLIVAAVLYLTVDPTLRWSVLMASLLGIALQVGLESLSQVFEKHNGSSNKNGRKLTGMAAFIMFMYLQVLNASFSFDGVIGAFAITTSVFLIMAGLGIGALWAQSLTVYMVRKGTLAKYRYLEHGAHWAILALGIVMLAKLYEVESPEWLTGSLGLVFIGTALVSSIFERRR